ncbi:MAG: LuxR family transcriptional regulator [Aliidongia sp.]
MAGAEDELARFVAQLDAAESLAEIEAAFATALERFGIKYYTYHIVRAANSPGRLPYVISSYPQSWVEHYFSQGYLDDDPIVGEALRRKLPFVWSNIAQPDDLSRRQRTLMSEARDAGLNNGVTIPLSGHGVETAAVSIVIPGMTAEAESFINDNKHLLHLMSLYFHYRAGTSLLQASLTATSARRRSVLSPREREVLEWIAQGKSAWEIASILGISVKSVEFHADGAKAKLGVFSRTHAVVKALMMGLLTVK